MVKLSAQRDPPVFKVKQGQPARQVQRALPGRKAKQVQLETLVLRAFKAKPDQRGHKV